MIAGFEEPTSGQVLLYGENMVGVPPNKRDMNMVFQSYALFPHMTVFENVAFGLRRKNVDKGEIDRRVDEMLELVDLTGRERRRPREMSGGQQQRVALARALVNHPRALLLDEPLGALDLKLRQAMQSELKRIQREVGITFVYVTHDQGEALTMSDRIAVMNAGRVEQLGTPREVYEQPRTRFVADFIGTSNLLTARADRIEDGCAVVGFGDQQRLVVPLRGVEPAGDLEVTVRPEKIRIGTAPIACRVPAARHTGRDRLPGHVHRLRGHHPGDARPGGRALAERRRLPRRRGRRRRGLALLEQGPLVPHRLGPRKGNVMTQNQKPLDPALLRGLTRAGSAAATCCGCSAPSAVPPRSARAAGSRRRARRPTRSESAIDKYWSAQKETGQLNWANWPLYLDTEGKSKHPTLEKFQKDTGIKVKYVEAIQDNGPFFAKVQPSSPTASTAATTSR